MRHDILLKIRLLSGANLYGKFASCSWRRNKFRYIMTATPWQRYHGGAVIITLVQKIHVVLTCNKLYYVLLSFQFINKANFLSLT